MQCKLHAGFCTVGGVRQWGESKCVSYVRVGLWTGGEGWVGDRAGQSYFNEVLSINAFKKVTKAYSVNAFKHLFEIKNSPLL